MRSFKVKIKGVTPYMQHRMDDATLEAWEKSRGKIIERKELVDEDIKRATFHSYMDDDGQFFIPSEHIRGALINAGAFVKSKVGNSRKSMKNVVAAMFFIAEEKVYLKDEFVIDKRSAVNKNVKARIITVRPKWEKWEVEFTLNIDNDSITDETITEILEYAGSYCGIGSFRPTNNGMFGRFTVEKMKSIS